VLTSLAKRGYFLGFYFWLDAIATLSLLFDIPAVMNLLTPVGAGQTNGQGGTLARAGRSAKAGSKMGRILRLVSVIRVMRQIQLYESRLKAARRSSAASGGSAEAARLVHPRNERNTRVGEKLSDLTTRCGASSCTLLHACFCDALGVCACVR
jgi:hypothetical protein